MVTQRFNFRSEFPRGRRGERGAAVFVVVMATTLLTAVGLFAAYSATLVDQAAGYERLAQETAQLAAYGTLTAAAELGSPAGKTYLDLMKQHKQQCTANVSRVNADCFKLFYKDLEARTQQLSTESLTVDDSGKIADVLGQHADPSSTSTKGDIRGDFAVELTDEAPTGFPQAGDDLGGPSSHVKVVLTTIAQIRPADALSCDDSVSTLTSQQSVRAQVIVSQ
jgi:hypothetical protein